MTSSVITFGCRVNQADSLEIEEELRARGAAAAPAHEADLVIVNSCSVTASADQGTRQTIRRIARDNPTARIVVTGCYATRRRDEIAGLPRVAAVIVNDDKPRVVPLALAAAMRADGARFELSTAERFGDGDGSCGAPLEPGVAGRTVFTLRVQTGCAEPCSYCIIPSTRGRPRSVPIDDVVREVGRAASAGYKEIALTGVHLGSYGRDLVPASSLAALLERLAAFDAVLFRISSLEPMDCSPAIVDLVASPGPFAPHFHLPLQHASARVLARMRRPYTADHYASVVDSIRARLPHASIGSDVIVGFPGEQDDDVDELAAYLESSPLTHLHVFPYSDRPGTEAAAMDGKVPGAAVRMRAERVRQIGRALAIRFRRSQVGAIRPALTIEDGSLVVTDNYLRLPIAPGLTRNERVRVRVEGETAKLVNW